MLLHRIGNHMKLREIVEWIAHHEPAAMTITVAAIAVTNTGFTRWFIPESIGSWLSTIALWSWMVVLMSSSSHSARKCCRDHVGDLKANAAKWATAFRFQHASMERFGKISLKIAPRSLNAMLDGTARGTTLALGYLVFFGVILSAVAVAFGAVAVLLHLAEQSLGLPRPVSLGIINALWISMLGSFTVVGHRHVLLSQHCPYCHGWGRGDDDDEPTGPPPPDGPPGIIYKEVIRTGLPAQQRELTHV